jgi:lysophospholipase L1-like esterase
MKNLLCLFFSLASVLHGEVRVACVGDSITFGARITDRGRLSYPAQLGCLLGKDYAVKNFGVNGRTMLQKGNAPYRSGGAYRASLDFKPDLVIIKLGTNDSKPQNWQHKAEFLQDTKDLIASYAALPGKPRILLCQPVPVVNDGQITEKIVRNEVAPLLRKAAFDTGVELVDLHPVLVDFPAAFPDGLHPNALGAQRMAEYLFQVISAERDAAFSFTPPTGSRPRSYHGYRQYDFKHQGHPCRVAVPRLAAKGAPCIWRGYYWGHQPQFDVAMLERGWHIVYCSVSNLFGSPKAVQRWDGFYDFLQQHAFGKKPVLEGMSRGGLIIHTWATANPGKVGGVIGDNAVLDLRSWPGDFNKPNQSHAPLWNKVKEVYGFANDTEARAYARYPVDTVVELKKAQVPLMYLVADADPVVPAKDNAFAAEKKLGDYARVIRKPGLGHHPHSLRNPRPMVDFAMEANGTTIHAVERLNRETYTTWPEELQEQLRGFLPGER